MNPKDIDLKIAYRKRERENGNRKNRFRGRERV